MIREPSTSAGRPGVIPTARYLELPGCGHTPQEECPSALTSVTRELLVELG